MAAPVAKSCGRVSNGGWSSPTVGTGAAITAARSWSRVASTDARAPISAKGNRRPSPPPGVPAGPTRRGQVVRDHPARADHWSSGPCHLCPPDDLRLHLGSGPNGLPEWVNIDLVGMSSDLAWDLRSRLPFPDGSARAGFLEHVIEHFALADALAVLKDCHRVLAAGGTTHVGVPDFGRHVRTGAIVLRNVSMTSLSSNGCHDHRCAHATSARDRESAS
jgi:hypothetical protein